MAATDTDSVQDHMTRLRMKMVQQKIANEKDKLQRPDSVESNNDLDSQVKLQQAMLRRQELLDKIRQEQMLNADFRRPRTYSARRRYTPSPLPAPPSRRSLPAEYFTHRGEETYRDRPDMSHVKHEIIHRVATPKPYHLPPIQNPPQAPAAPQTTFIPPPQVTMQAPAQPMIITAPQAPQHIIQQIPHPIFQNLVPNQGDNSRQMFGKADFMEMLMMQNAQMHQLVMQQMMLKSAMPSGGGMAMTESAPRPAQSVHHHHYTTPAPAAAPPVVHHYTTMPAAPAADWGPSYPIRGELPGYQPIFSDYYQ
ncbi:hypothetical protein CHS0354_033358 [Potamilus streckersoni]|uniref:DUF4587 domain-containing protein n=1 Tax=Potamilus streckersoni TaxID=2493646 RepID=A0AAE0RTF6_9BIVA|nr:hypothetical protein CHS0354_033358 [Potamilus streckersoni]